jgi:hypothetical protein
MIDKYSFPLTPLRFMARYGIREFHLKRVEMLIVFYFFPTFLFIFYMNVIFLDCIEKPLVFFIAERRGLDC